MDQFEKMMSRLSDMEEICPHDKLSGLIAETMGAKNGAEDELDEDDLDLVSAAGAQPYQEFLRRLGGRADRS